MLRKLSLSWLCAHDPVHCGCGLRIEPRLSCCRRLYALHGACRLKDLSEKDEKDEEKKDESPLLTLLMKRLQVEKLVKEYTDAK